MAGPQVVPEQGACGRLPDDVGLAGLAVAGRGSDAAQARYKTRYGIDAKAYLQTALSARRSGWGLQSLAKFADYDPQVQALYGDLFANRIAVREYGTQAAAIVNQMIDELQKIMKIAPSKQ